MANKNAATLAIIDIESGIRSIVPSATPAYIAKLTKRSREAGITTPEQIKEAVEVCQAYKKSYSNLLVWMGTGLALKDVTQCIEYSDKLPEFTIAMICKYYKAIDFRSAFPDTIMETFSSFFSDLGGRFPANRLLHIIEDRFNDDILAAYHMAVEDPDMFTKILEGKTFTAINADENEEGDDSWTVDS